MTKHTGQFNGEKVSYSATVGETIIPGPDGKAAGSMVTTSYVRDGVKDKAKRKPFEPVGEVGLICREHCFRNGLVMRATRDSMLISPPLTWTKANVDEFMTLTRKALDLTLADVRKKGWL